MCLQVALTDCFLGVSHCFPDVRGFRKVFLQCNRNCEQLIAEFHSCKTNGKGVLVLRESVLPGASRVMRCRSTELGALVDLRLKKTTEM